MRACTFSGYTSEVVIFQSTPPARGATGRLQRRYGAVYISIHAPREGGDRQKHHQCNKPLQISIHAPREGGDFPPRHLAVLSGHFNPRPPRGGRHRPRLHGQRVQKISIHAPREGGDGDVIRKVLKELISIHAPREGGDAHAVHDLIQRGISIHAPREGGDILGTCIIFYKFGFQSTPPARGATPAGAAGQ